MALLGIAMENKDIFAAMNELADWCVSKGSQVNAKIVFMCDAVSDTPLGVDCTSRSSIDEFRAMAETFNRECG